MHVIEKIKKFLDDNPEERIKVYIKLQLLFLFFTDLKEKVPDSEYPFRVSVIGVDDPESIIKMDSGYKLVINEYFPLDLTGRVIKYLLDKPETPEVTVFVPRDQAIIVDTNLNKAVKELKLNTRINVRVATNDDIQTLTTQDNVDGVTFI